MEMRRDVHSIDSCEPVQASSNTPLEKFKMRVEWEAPVSSVCWAYFLGQRHFAVCTGVNYNEKNIRLLQAYAIPDEDARIPSQRGHGKKGTTTSFGHCCPDPHRHLLADTYRYITETQYKLELCFQKPKFACRNTAEAAQVSGHNWISLFCFSS